MAAGATYEPIATQTLGSAATDTTFSSIPSTYTDLRIVVLCTGGAGGDPALRFNGDTASNYSTTYLIGNGTTASSAQATTTNVLRSTNDSSPPLSMYIFNVMSYAGSTYKTALVSTARDNNGSGSVVNTVGMWRSTAAINSVTVTGNFGVINAGTTITLYGIKSA